MDRETIWDLVESCFHAFICVLAIAMLLICEMLTDISSYPQYEPGIRYELAMPAIKPRL